MNQSASKTANIHSLRTIMEDKLALKRRIYEACLQQQQRVVQNARDAMKEAQENANNSEDSSEEGSVSFREQLHHTRDMFTMQLQNTQNDLDALQQVPHESISNTIESGAVVHTDKQHFFISVSLNRFDLDGKTYYPISVSAPIFQAMIGLKAGDSFSFRDRDYRIVDVF